MSLDSGTDRLGLRRPRFSIRLAWKDCYHGTLDCREPIEPEPDRGLLPALAERSGSVDSSWRNFFEGYELGRRSGDESAPSGAVDCRPGQAAVTRLIDAYREFGHYLADLDPLKLKTRRESRRTSRAGSVWPDRSRPGSGFLQQVEPERCFNPARADRDLAQDLLPHDRRRVHAYSQTPRSASGCSSGWSRCATGRRLTSSRSGGSSTSSTWPSCSRRFSTKTMWARSGFRSKGARC